MKPDYPGAVADIKMTSHCIFHHYPDLFKEIGFSIDGMVKGSGFIAAFIAFLNKKQYFGFY